MTRGNSKLEQEKSAISGMLHLGCDRAAAALAVGWTDEELDREAKSDPEFAQALAIAEGKAELHHMRLVHSATQDEKYWRAATWWLARRAARREARGSSHKITSAEITSFVEELVDVIFNEVKAEDDRDRVIASLLAKANASDPVNVARLMGGTGPCAGENKEKEPPA